MSHKIFEWMIENNFVSCEQTDGKYKVFITQDGFDLLLSQNNTEQIFAGKSEKSANRAEELNMILEAAKNVAQECGSTYIATEHLVYAMLDNECIAGKILRACNVNAVKYAEYFERSIDSNIDHKGFLPRAKHMIEQSEEFAKNTDGEGAKAGTEHLLLAILSSNDCLAMRILKAIDVDIENLASTLEKVLRTND